jgi:hypothetical protein
LDEYFLSCDPSRILGTLGVTRFLLDPVNTNGQLQKQLTFQNKKRQVELVWTPRLREEDVGTDTTQICDSDNEIGENTEIYDIPDNGSSWDFSRSLSDLERHCEEDESYYARMIAMGMDVLYRDMETKVMTKIQTLFGAFAVGESNVAANVKTVQTKKATACCNDPDINFLSEIEFASRNAAYCSGAYAFGWNETYKAFKKLDATCCADNGLDLAQFKSISGITFLPSEKVETALGANRFFTMAAGAAQIGYWNEFMGANGIRVIDTEIYKQGVLIHPILGLPVDYSWTFNCGKITVQLKLDWDLFGLPTDLFCADDRLNGVTFINEYYINNPA